MNWRGGRLSTNVEDRRPGWQTGPLTQSVMDLLARDQAASERSRMAKLAEDAGFIRDKFGVESGLDESMPGGVPILREMANVKLLMRHYGLDHVAAAELMHKYGGLGGAAAFLDFTRANGLR